VTVAVPAVHLVHDPDAAADARLEPLLARDPVAQIYAHPRYHRALETMVGGRRVVALAGPASAPVGALTWLERETDAGRILNALPWFGSHGGPCIAADRPPAERIAVAAALAAAFRAAVDRDGVLSGTMILGFADDGPRRAAIEAALAPEAVDERIAQVTPLPPAVGEADEIGETLLRETFGQKTRNLVRKGRRQSFDVSVRDDDAAWAALHALHAAGMEAIGAPVKPAAHLAALRTLPEQDRGLWIAGEGREIRAAMLLLRWGGTVEYVVPAVDPDHRSRQPISVLVHAAMIDAVQRGDHRWSWGGTPAGQDRLHHFKAGFGARDVPYAYLCRSGPGGRARLAAVGRAGLPRLAPWYYAWPFDQLDAEADR